MVTKKKWNMKKRYTETYKEPGLRIRDHIRPTLPSATGFTVAEAFIRAAGRIELDGISYEYQDVRILLREGI